MISRQRHSSSQLNLGREEEARGEVEMETETRRLGERESEKLLRRRKKKISPIKSYKEGYVRVRSSGVWPPAEILVF